MDKKILIQELERIRIRLTEIYMELGNPEDCNADEVLSTDIGIFESRYNAEEGQSKIKIKRVPGNIEEKTIEEINELIFEGVRFTILSD